MRWNHYIDLRVGTSKAVRASCRSCGGNIDRGSHRVEAIPVLGRPELLHVACAAKRAPDLARRKVVDRDPDWPAEVIDDIARFVPETVTPAPRSYMRTPILDLSYDEKATSAGRCVYCGQPCPGEKGPGHGHAVRAFSIDGERRFHPACAAELAPGICRRIALEPSERWPADVRAFFARAVPERIKPTARSPWRNTGGIPTLEVSPSARAACRYCQEKIGKGELRIGREQIYGMRRSPVYFHISCYARSDDFHPRILEMLALRAPAEIERRQLEELSAALPEHPKEDDDVPPLLERMLALFDASRAALQARAQKDQGPQTPGTENRVEIPEWFFEQGS